MKDDLPNCARCSFKMSERLCKTEEGKAPPSCPTQNKEELFEQCLKEYKKPEILEFAKQASIQEGEGYGQRELGYSHVKPIKPRIEEIIEFAQKMKYKRLGFVFCVGLRKEASVVEKLLSSNGFEVVSVLCKAGRSLKDLIGITDEEKIYQGRDEAMCNPIYQAKLLNHEKAEFNILIGLCVGHDSLFFQYTEVPTTVLAVKDRITGHNPLAAIYTADTYYRKVKQAER